MGICHRSGMQNFGEIWNPITGDGFGVSQDIVDRESDFFQRIGSAQDEVVLDDVGVVQAKFNRGIRRDVDGSLIETKLIGDSGDFHRPPIAGSESEQQHRELCG